MSILLAVAWLPVTMALVYLAREAEVFDRPRRFVCRVRFIRAMLTCAPCTSAWVAPWTSGGLWALSGEAWSLPALVLCLVVAPLASVGALWMVTILSPLEAFGLLAARSSRKEADGKETQPDQAG